MEGLVQAVGRTIQHEQTGWFAPLREAAAAHPAAVALGAAVVSVAVLLRAGAVGGVRKLLSDHAVYVQEAKRIHERNEAMGGGPRRRHWYGGEESDEEDEDEEGEAAAAAAARCGRVYVCLRRAGRRLSDRARGLASALRSPTAAALVDELLQMRVRHVAAGYALMLAAAAFSFASVSYDVQIGSMVYSQLEGALKAAAGAGAAAAAGSDGVPPPASAEAAAAAAGAPAAAASGGGAGALDVRGLLSSMWVLIGWSTYWRILQRLTAAASDRFFKSARAERSGTRQRRFQRSLLLQDRGFYSAHGSRLSGQTLMDAGAVDDLLLTHGPRLLEHVLDVAVGIAGCLTVDWQLALVSTVVLLPSMFGSYDRLWRSLEPYETVAEDRDEAVRRTVGEAFDNVDLVQMAAAEELVVREVAAAEARAEEARAAKLWPDTLVGLVSTLQWTLLSNASKSFAMYRALTRTPEPFTIASWTAFKHYESDWQTALQYHLPHVLRNIRTRWTAVERYIRLRARRPAVELTLRDEARALGVQSGGRGGAAAPSATVEAAAAPSATAAAAGATVGAHEPPQPQLLLRSPSSKGASEEPAAVLPDAQVPGAQRIGAASVLVASGGDDDAAAPAAGALPAARPTLQSASSSATGGSGGAPSSSSVSVPLSRKRNASEEAPAAAAAASSAPAACTAAATAAPAAGSAAAAAAPGSVPSSPPARPALLRAESSALDADEGEYPLLPSASDDGHGLLPQPAEEAHRSSSAAAAAAAGGAGGPVGFGGAGAMPAPAAADAAAPRAPVYCVVRVDGALYRRLPRGNITFSGVSFAYPRPDASAAAADAAIFADEQGGRGKGKGKGKGKAGKAGEKAKDAPSTPAAKAARGDSKAGSAGGSDSPASAPSDKPAVPAEPKLVLSGLSFTVPAGTLVALVGASGSGKTTVFRLLCRFYDPSAGSISLDGYDLRQYSARALRRTIGYVEQGPKLLSKSVRDNILFGFDRNSPSCPTQADVEAAARKAEVHDVIMGLDGGKGYDTVLGGGGVTLSGGQVQRIAIARALVRNPRILLLDEATSALDPPSESAVTAALQAAMAGRTTFVIAHRLSTVMHADLIMLLEGGRIVEAGTHKSMLAAGGKYAAFVKPQLMDASGSGGSAALAAAATAGSAGAAAAPGAGAAAAAAAAAAGSATHLSWDLPAETGTANK